MSNHLRMDKAQSIHHLHDLGWSQRRIAATLKVDRKSVRRQLKGAVLKGTAPMEHAPTALEAASDNSKGTSAPTGQPLPESASPELETLSVPPSSRGVCVAYHQVIVAGLEQRLSAKRIYQDLVTDHGFEGSYAAFIHTSRTRLLIIPPRRRGSDRLWNRCPSYRFVG